MTYHCEAGQVLFKQINRTWPRRDHASDGWIGTGGDHKPAPPDGVVRASDIDSSFGGMGGYNTTETAWKLANQLRKEMIGGDKRISYIIAWNPEKKADFICSTNPSYQPLGVWRNYTGDSHVNHIHISFTPAGDHNDRPFKCALFTSEQRSAVRKLIHAGEDQLSKIRRRLARLRRRLRRL